MVDWERCACGGLFTAAWWREFAMVAPLMAKALGVVEGSDRCDLCVMKERHRTPAQPGDEWCGVPRCDRRVDMRWPASRWFVVRSRTANGSPCLDWELRQVCLDCSTAGDLQPGEKPDREPAPYQIHGGRSVRAFAAGAPGTKR